MDDQIPEDPYRILARERSHEDARQTVATNRMLVQSLVIINGGAATAALACYGAHNASGPGKSAALLTIILSRRQFMFGNVLGIASFRSIARAPELSAGLELLWAPPTRTGGAQGRTSSSEP